LRIADSYLRKALATIVVAVVFVFFQQTVTRDSRSEATATTVMEHSVLPQAGARLLFKATAYCKGETTASGVGVRTGIAAADPAILPVGSVVRLETPSPRYSGVWTVMDTGPAVRGRTVDLYLWNCNEALKFGRRSVRLTVLRLGWSPENSIPGMVDKLFHKREAESKKLAPPAPPILLSPAPVTSPDTK
jgi:3D (Asp-Asp-Asp) domain-containing protein